MKKKMATKLSALFIALCMILSVMPVQFAEAAVGDVVKTLYFVDPYITSLDNDGIDSAAGWELKEHAYVGSESATAPTFYDTFMNWDLGAVGSKLSLNFKIDADGYYAPSALFGLILDSHSPDLKVSVDGTHIGNIIAATNTGENVVFDFDTVYLTADTHTLTFEVTKNPVGERGNMYMTSFTFKVADKPAAAVPVEKTLYFDGDHVSSLDAADIDSVEGWEFNEYVYVGSESAKTPTFYGVYMSWDLGAVGSKLSVDFKIDADGYYSTSALFGTVISSHSADFKMSVDGMHIGDVITEGKAGDNVNFDLGTVYLTADTHTLTFEVIKNPYAERGNMYMKSFTFAPADAPAVENFGTQYAYVRENYEAGESAYTLVLVAGIDSLDYDSVGFNYKIGDADYASTAAIANVYKQLTLNGSEDAAYVLTPDELDVGEDGYIFYAEIDITAAQAASAVMFNAFADASGDVVTGLTSIIATAVANAQ